MCFRCHFQHMQLFYTCVWLHWFFLVYSQKKLSIVFGMCDLKHTVATVVMTIVWSYGNRIMITAHNSYYGIIWWLFTSYYCTSCICLAWYLIWWWYMYVCMLSISTCFVVCFSSSVTKNYVSDHNSVHILKYQFWQQSGLHGTCDMLRHKFHDITWHSLFYIMA